VREALGGAVRDLRVRDLGGSVRLEVDADLVERARADAAVSAAIREAGFATEAMTVAEFRSGSMNERLSAADRRAMMT
jgi:pyridinium-3,5-biscarboxylic acid mononucleotide sulfurtransferase